MHVSNAHETTCQLCHVGVGMVAGGTHIAETAEFKVSETRGRCHLLCFRQQGRRQTSPVPQGAVPVADNVLAPYGLTHADMRVRGATVRDEVSGSGVRLVAKEGAPIVEAALLDELSREPVKVPD